MKGKDNKIGIYIQNCSVLESRGIARGLGEWRLCSRNGRELCTAENYVRQRKNFKKQGACLHCSYSDCYNGPRTEIVSDGAPCHVPTCLPDGGRWIRDMVLLVVLSHGAHAIVVQMEGLLDKGVPISGASWSCPVVAPGDIVAPFRSRVIFFVVVDFQKKKGK